MSSPILTELHIQKVQRIRLCILAHILELIKKIQTKPIQTPQTKNALKSHQTALPIEGPHSAATVAYRTRPIPTFLCGS